MDRHVNAVAVAVFEHQELAWLAADLHQRQADIAADAVALVHDGCARLQALQVAQDRGRIRLLPAAAALLACARAEQRRFGQQQQRRIGECEAGEILGHRDRKCGLSGGKLRPVGDHAGLATVRREHAADDLAAAGRIGGDQHAPGVLGDELQQRRERLRGMRIESERGWNGAGEIVRERVGARRIVGAVGTQAADLYRGVGRQPDAHLLWRQEQFGRREQRALGIVAPVLVARGDCRPGRLQRRVHVEVGGNDDLAWQVAGDTGGRFMEQRQVELDAGRRETLGDAAIDRHARHVAFEARAEAAAEGAHRLGIQGQLTRRQQAEFADRFARTLRVRVEAADRVDGVVEHVDAHRLGGPGREDVEQRTAQREFPRGLHLTDTGVTGGCKARAQAHQRPGGRPPADRDCAPARRAPVAVARAGSRRSAVRCRFAGRADARACAAARTRCPHAVSTGRRAGLPSPGASGSRAPHRRRSAAPPPCARARARRAR